MRDERPEKGYWRADMPKLATRKLTSRIPEGSSRALLHLMFVTRATRMTMVPGIPIVKDTRAIQTRTILAVTIYVLLLLMGFLVDERLIYRN